MSITHKLFRAVAAALMLAASFVLLAGSATPSGASSSPLVFEVAIAFTGPDAPFGPETMAGCVPAARLINQAGGVMGHSVQCQSTNTQGDPADAVPAVEKMLATGGNIVGVLGPSSDEASAVVPIINAASIPMFPVTGQPSFDKTNMAYFWRTLPADDVLGYAMAAWGREKGYQQAAAVFGNSVGGQAQVPTLTKGYQHLKYNLSPNLSIALDQSSYRSEIEKVIAQKPSAIYTEMDPQTGATFLSEMKQLTTKSIPIVGDQVILEPSWLKAVGRAIGKSALDNSCVAIQPYSHHRGRVFGLQGGVAGLQEPGPGCFPVRVRPLRHGSVRRYRHHGAGDATGPFHESECVQLAHSRRGAAGEGRGGSEYLRSGKGRAGLQAPYPVCGSERTSGLQPVAQLDRRVRRRPL